MHIVLIEPPHSYLVQQRTQPPIGLLYIASTLRQNDHTCSLIRLWDVSLEQLQTIPDGDLFGISSTSLDYSTSVTIARYLKEHKQAPVVLGGYHATVCGDQEGAFDVVCRGEGEHAILEIIEDIRQKRLKNEYIGQMVSDLDALPFPARDMLSYQGGNIFAFNTNFYAGGSTVIAGSRGCPFRCAFCGTRNIFSGRHRRRSPANIAAEIEHVIEEYQIRQFRFSDETFTLHRQHALELCDRLKNLDISWKCSTRANCVRPDILRAMKEAGCEEIAIGAESGDNHVLNVLYKDQSPEEVSQACGMIMDTGISVRLLLMVNTPGETRETVDRNITFLEKTPYTMASCTIFKPLPGSAIWDDPEKFKVKILTRDLEQYNICLFRTGENSSVLHEPPAIYIQGLSFEEMYKNRREMLEYMESQKKLNKG